ncbi:unnamed protein product [Lactuca virosa]|uniref:F-box domain-containing protein n=1 Tax=Lactuca virosa TaxID=75947 RepID=A0AAU9LTI9_9ASTR|nr:unnamed protein product [Lactuca virosa]
MKGKGKSKSKGKSRDRISALPQDTIEKILTHMPIRDAVRTSILSRKWRYYWTSMPKLVFDVNLNPDAMVASSMVVLSGYEEVDIYKFVNAIFHVLLLRRAPIFEFSFLVIIETEIYSEIDQIILHLSRDNNINKFIFKILGIDSYLLPRSFFSLQGLEHLDLSYCIFEFPLMNKGFSRLKCLRFCEVDITHKMLFRFLTNCPLLEEFTWARDYRNTELTECDLVKLFKCLPLVQVLKIHKLYIKDLGAGSYSMPHTLPISLPHLKVLVLGVCFLELSTVLCVINSSPNVEKVKVEICWDHHWWCLQQTFINLPDIQDYSGLNLDHLKELEITNFHNHGLEMEFVKLIMCKSPVLKKARIELHSHVSVNEEVKMLRGLVHMPFPRASPAAGFTIERRKY